MKMLSRNMAKYILADLPISLMKYLVLRGSGNAAVSQVVMCE